jgi:hypothetical protein
MGGERPYDFGIEAGLSPVNARQEGQRMSSMRGSRRSAAAAAATEIDLALQRAGDIDVENGVKGGAIFDPTGGS